MSTTLPAVNDFEYDVIIVGAGPASLAVAARLLERRPSSLYTDAESMRSSYLNKHKGQCNCNGPPQRQSLKILVLDKYGSRWMQEWRDLFDSYGITSLRSPMFFHPDPLDADSMLSYAWREGRETELLEIPNVAGKERTKYRQKRKRGKDLSRTDVNERDRRDYFTPSTKLFFDFCSSVASRYQISSIVLQKTVHSVEYRGNDAPHWRISTTDGLLFTSKTVVLAVGIRERPNIPLYLPGIPNHEGWCHTGSLPSQKSFFNKEMKRKIHAGVDTTVVVIGGGLSSAQIVDKAIKMGVKKVFFVCRSPIKLKHFDFDFEWVAKLKNLAKSSFWSQENDEERLRMINKARNGGSITPRYWNILQAHERSGALTILPNTTITSATWDPSTSHWSLATTTQPVLSKHTACTMCPEPVPPTLTRTLPPIDYIYAATGTSPDIASLPILSSLHKQHPINIVGGLPCLTEDLAWSEDVPLFCVGGYAALRIGPDAFNLGGGRAAAERVALKVLSLLGRDLEKGRDVPGSERFGMFGRLGIELEGDQEGEKEHDE